MQFNSDYLLLLSSKGNQKVHYNNFFLTAESSVIFVFHHGFRPFQAYKLGSQNSTRKS